MNASDIKLDLFRQIDRLPPSLLEDLQTEVTKFIIQRTNPTRKERKFGAMKGLILHMADDFDAPLEDFKDYM